MTSRPKRQQQNKSTNKDSLRIPVRNTERFCLFCDLFSSFKRSAFGGTRTCGATAPPNAKSVLTEPRRRAHCARRLYPQRSSQHPWRLSKRRLRPSPEAATESRPRRASPDGVPPGKDTSKSISAQGYLTVTLLHFLALIGFALPQSLPLSSMPSVELADTQGLSELNLLLKILMFL